MSSGKLVVYIKGEQNTEVNHRDVMLKDVVTIECADQNVRNHLQVLPLLRIPEKGQHRMVISVLRIIACIHQKYPNIQVENIGVPDLIVTYEETKKEKKILEYMKVTFISVLVFFGAAFSIMSFNNDISLTRMFGQVYELVKGEPSSGFSILEISYSVGIVVGILVFFNHFGKKRFSVDPTPMEVEMRQYETDIQNTLIEMYSREGEEMDVD